MLKTINIIPKSLSVRISLMAVLAIAVLLSAALFIMLHFARKTVKEEALRKAEQTLDGTVQQIDNILLSVEQSAGNIYWDMLFHLRESERMETYCRTVVETNPHIVGCAISFEPYYFKAHGEYFQIYVHRVDSSGLKVSDSPIIQPSTFGNLPYPQQSWYYKCVKLRHPIWINPMGDASADDDAIVTFSLPIYDKEKIVGVMGVDVSLTRLTRIIEEGKPSPNSYAAVVERDGSYIVHPDISRLYHESIGKIAQQETEPALRETARDMLAGKSGYRAVHLNGRLNYVFYKPFRRAVVPGRANEELGWSIALVYPENDIFGIYNQLLYFVLVIALVGIGLLYFSVHCIVHRKLVPLRALEKSAHRIADGHYDEVVPDSDHDDEVGLLQDHFQEMQRALSVNIDELKRLTESLREKGMVLGEAYEEAKEADKVKTTFLHHMTDKMTYPVNAISASVGTLCSNGGSPDRQTTEKAANEIQQQGTEIIRLLDELLNISQQGTKQ